MIYLNCIQHAPNGSISAIGGTEGANGAQKHFTEAEAIARRSMPGPSRSWSGIRMVIRRAYELLTTALTSSWRRTATESRPTT